MLRIAPHRYQSARGALGDLGEHLTSLGERALVVANKTAFERFEDVVRNSLKDSMLGVSFEVCLGECCLPEIERLAEVVKKEDADMLVGIGAGKTLDVAKYTAQKTGCRTVTIPSVASSYAAFTNQVYLFNEEGNFIEVEELEVCPDLLVLDYKVVGVASPRHIRAGMGAALATSYQFTLSQEELEQHHPSRLAFELATHLRKQLFERGEKALQDVRREEVTGRVETILETNILQAGLVSSLGGMSFRSMVAQHLAHELKPFAETQLLFGELVAFGLLVEHMLYGARPESLRDLFEFFREVGLPLSLEDLKLPENQRDKILSDAAENITEKLGGWSFPFEFHPESLLEAVDRTDGIGQQVIQSGVDSL